MNLSSSASLPSAQTARKPFAKTLQRLLTPALLVIICLSILPRYGQGGSVGDGGEYVAMLVAWAETGKPYFTPASRDIFERIYTVEFPGRGHGAHTFERIGMFRLPDGTQDAPHAPFYSLLAAPFYWPCRWLGLEPTYCFTLLHLTLLGLAALLARRLFGNRGALAVFALTVASPVLWYVNKPHTEWFTVLLGLCAVMLWCRGHFVNSLLPLSMITIQNPPFGFVTAFAGVYALLVDRKYFLSGRGLAITGLSFFLTLFHPVFYKLRQGVWTPQMINGGIAPGLPDLHRVLAVFVDPDLGLLPNFLFGVAALLLLAGLLLSRQVKLPRRALFYAPLLVLTIAVLALSQAMTGNMNSGGTMGMTRYAFWYVPAFFPIYLVLLDWFRARPRAVQGVAAFVFIAGAAVVMRQNKPSLPERYTLPTPFARAVYANVPSLYNPVEEIYLERYSGLSETPRALESWAVLNPDCNKILFRRAFLPVHAGDSRFPWGGCEAFRVDPEKLRQLAETSMARVPERPSLYLNLEPAVARAALEAK